MVSSKGIARKESVRGLLTLELFLFFSLIIPITQAPAASAQTVQPVFYESFDSFDSIKANGGTYRNITLVAGKSGTGALIQGSGSLVYPAKDHFNFQKGTIEFWIKPNWDGRYSLPSLQRYLLKVLWGTTQSLFVPILSYSPPGSKVGNIMMPQFNDRGTYNRRLVTKEPYTIMQWQANTWRKVVIYWDFTIPDDPINGNQSYLVAQIDGTYTTFMRVGGVVPEAPIDNAQIIVGATDSTGRYSADAVIDELKIYDTSLLPVVPFPEYQYNPFYPATEATFRSLFKNDGFCENFKTYNTDPADCPKLSDVINPGENVLFFKRPAFEAVYENYVPQAAEIGNQLDYQAPQGECGTIFFNVYSRVDLNSVNVTYTDFQGVSGIIPKANFDLRVVKNWFQAARGASTVADQLPVYVPGLLLHNDQIPLETDQTLSQIKVPSLPILDHVETKIRQYTSRQFAMIVKVPEGTPSGYYFSTIVLSADGIAPQTLTLNLEVLPFMLKDTGKTYTIWHMMDTDKNYAKAMRLNIWDILRMDMVDIKNHGLNSIIFYSYNDGSYYLPLSELEVQTAKIANAQQLGFKKAIIYTAVRPNNITQGITSALTDMMTSYGFEPWLYAVDEFGSVGLSYMMNEEISKSMVIRGVGGKVVTTTVKAASDALDDPNNSVYTPFGLGTYQPLDWAIYSLGEQYQFDLMAGIAQKNPNKVESYYWQCRDFQLNRYLFGYYPLLTGLDGPAIHLYRAAGSNYQFYNDFDWTGPTRRFRPYELAYPSVEGPVPTFQWEAVREGILDGKYLATWKYYKDEAAKTHPDLAQQSESVVNNILEHYQDIVPTTNTAAYRVSMAQYEADRKTLINEIKNLMSLTNQ